MKKSTVLLLAFVLFGFMAKSQDYAKIQEAFKNSYAHEKSALYTKAIEDLKAVNYEGSYEINLRLGWLNYMAGLFTESMAYYQKAMAIMPLSIEAKLGYVYPASTLGNWDMVKTQYIEILKIDEKNYTANYRLGLIFYGKKDYTTAFKYFETIANLYPFDYDNLLMYAWTNFKLGKLREAKVLFNKVLLNKPTDTSALEGLSYIK
ncbi:MAG: tetratricopeptide repeat protein [Bacteroidota bacterium]